MDNIKADKFFTQYENIIDESARIITKIQLDALDKNHELPPSYYIPIYEYISYVESLCEFSKLELKDEEYTVLWNDRSAKGYKYISKEVLDFYEAVGNTLPLYDDLNFLFEINKLKSWIHLYTVKVKKLNLIDPIIATIPVVGYNAKAIILENKDNAILLNRSIKKILLCMCDLLDRDINKSSFEEQEFLNNSFSDFFITYSKTRDLYFCETNLVKLETISSQSKMHYIYIDIALTYVIAHEYWHLSADNHLKNKVINTKNKLFNSFPEAVKYKFEKMYKEMNVDFAAIVTVIELFSQFCSPEDIYEGLYLSLVVGIIDNLLDDCQIFNGQPDISLRIETAKIILTNKLYFDKNYVGRFEKNFDYFWQKNKTYIGFEIVNT